MTDQFSKREQKTHPTYHVGRVLWYAILVIELALIIRLVVQVFVSTSHSVIELTRILTMPVALLVPNSLGAELITFVSMLLYWVLGYCVMKVVAHFRPVPETSMEAAMEREL